MPSRNADDLHPKLKEAWEYLRRHFMATYPDAPEPRLSCTFRGEAEQMAAYNARPRKSNARWLESLHNFKPAYAFDVYFNDDNGTPVDKSDDSADWDFINFRRFGALAKEIGLVWGGDWPDLVDGPHLQFDMTAKQAALGVVPDDALPKLPAVTYTPVKTLGTPGGWRVVSMIDRQVQQVFEISQIENDTLGTRDVVIRISPSNRRVTIDARGE